MSTASPSEGHFETPEQQETAATLGMWIFLATEVLFFGGLFMAYAFVWWASPGTVAAASRHLELLLGSINTFILLTSSFVMTLGLWFHDQGNRRAAAWLLTITAMLGCVFLGIKGFEYSQVIKEELLPGAHFRYGPTDTLHARDRGIGREDPMPEGIVGALGTRGSHDPRVIPGVAQLFFWLYFVMTALHGIHLLVGIVLVGLLVLGLRRNWDLSPNLMHNAGLYWHFVDLIWIFLFPLLYLAR